MGARTEVRLASVDLFDSHFPNGGVAVRVCPLDDSGKGPELLGSPRDEQRADACQRNSDLRGIRGEQLVSAPHEARLEGARRGVKAGVQQRRIRLARSGADVRTRLEQGAIQMEARQLARNRGTNDARTGDDDVAVQLPLRERSASAAAAASQRASRSCASAAGIRGSNT